MVHFLTLLQEHGATTAGAAVDAANAGAEHAAAGAQSGLLSPSGGLMFWTLLIFLVLWFILTKYAFKPITAAVEAREKALQDAIEAATRNREESERILAGHRAAIESARGEAQRLIAEGRAAGDKMRAGMLEETKVQQQELLDRARREIEQEKDRAIADLRREAVDLAIAGASKVIEKNLDDASNRKIVEKFLSTIPVSHKGK